MRKYKQIEPHFATALGSELKRARERRKLTLVDISAKIGVHYGQLSRFESGDFKVLSQNLQKFAKYLRVRLMEPDDDLSVRFQKLAARSPRHLAACCK
jgi:transcriptional regulator with XRE-family HTH domain